MTPSTSSARSIPMAVASCAVMGGMVATFDAAGHQLTGQGYSGDSLETREERRRKFFKKKSPLSSDETQSQAA